MKDTINVKIYLEIRITYSKLRATRGVGVIQWGDRIFMKYGCRGNWDARLEPSEGGSDPVGGGRISSFSDAPLTRFIAKR